MSHHVVLAPVVGAPITVDQVRAEVARELTKLHEINVELHELARRDADRVVEALRGDLHKAHARLEVLETRWHERLIKWLSR